MISAALKAKSPQVGKAIQVFRSMLQNSMEVGIKTYLKLIEACADARDILAADEVFLAMRASGHTIYSKVIAAVCFANVGKKLTCLFSRFEDGFV